jgi:hypothetical protein
VHLPVPLAIGLRFLVHLSWRFSWLPLWIIVFFAGQYLGGKLRSRG